MVKQKTVFITGSNRGLGLEFTKQLSKKNYAVFGCCRNIQSATDLMKLTKRFPYIKIFQGDINNNLDLEAIAEEIGQQPIDILINNAGISGNNNETLESLSEDNFLEVFKTNTIAPLRVIKCLYKNILAGQEKKIVNISSGMGSISQNTSGGFYTYRSSKAALNALIKALAIDLQKEGIKMLLLHPGWVKTDMGTNQAPLTPEQSIEGMLQVIESYIGNEPAPFLNYKGETIPW
jgi:NAD(P)-dependent dehydrogenase (short-subunit alcohol dehydrogenase family)